MKMTEKPTKYPLCEEYNLIIYIDKRVSKDIYFQYSRLEDVEQALKQAYEQGKLAGKKELLDELIYGNLIKDWRLKRRLKSQIGDKK